MENQRIVKKKKTEKEDQYTYFLVLFQLDFTPGSYKNKRKLHFILCTVDVVKKRENETEDQTIYFLIFLPTGLYAVLSQIH